MNIDYSKLFSLNRKDILNGAINAIIASVVVGLGGIVTQSGFDIFSVEWSPILHSVLNWAFAAFIGSVGKSFMTTTEGKVLGLQVK